MQASLRPSASVKAFLLVLFAMLLLVSTELASAAGEKGPYRGAQVYCQDSQSNFGDTKVWIQALVSRYPGFSWQDVKYAHYLYNIDTRVWTAMTFEINSYTQSYYWQFRDNHLINSGWQYAPEPWRLWEEVPPGRYEVWTKYYWYNGYWAESSWVPASSYENNLNGSGFMSYCYL
jgi:hypothetical protein